MANFKEYTTTVDLSSDTVTPFEIIIANAIEGNQASSQFGTSISITNEWLAVGSQLGRDADDIPTGSVVMFRKVNGSWVEHSALTPPVKFAGDGFTYPAISGNRMIVGAIGDDVDNSVDSSEESGKIYAYYFDGTSWILEQQIKPADLGPNSNFGRMTSIDGDIFAASDFIGQDGGTPVAARVFIYKHDGSQWNLQHTIQYGTEMDGPGPFYLYAGSSVSVSGNKLAIAAGIRLDAPTDTSGDTSIDIYETDGTTWFLSDQINQYSVDLSTPSLFNILVNLQNNTLLIHESLPMSFEIPAQTKVFDITGGAHSEDQILVSAGGVYSAPNYISDDESNIALIRTLANGSTEVDCYSLSGGSYVKVGTVVATGFYRGIAADSDYFYIGDILQMNPTSGEASGGVQVYNSGSFISNSIYTAQQKSVLNGVFSLNMNQGSLSVNGTHLIVAGKTTSPTDYTVYSGKLVLKAGDYVKLSSTDTDQQPTFRVQVLEGVN